MKLCDKVSFLGMNFQCKKVRFWSKGPKFLIWSPEITILVLFQDDDLSDKILHNFLAVTHNFLVHENCL